MIELQLVLTKDSVKSTFPEFKRLKAAALCETLVFFYCFVLAILNAILWPSLSESNRPLLSFVYCLFVVGCLFLSRFFCLMLMPSSFPFPTCLVSSATLLSFPVLFCLVQARISYQYNHLSFSVWQ